MEIHSGRKKRQEKTSGEDDRPVVQQIRMLEFSYRQPCLCLKLYCPKSVNDLMSSSSDVIFGLQACLSLHILFPFYLDCFLRDFHRVCHDAI